MNIIRDLLEIQFIQDKKSNTQLSSTIHEKLVKQILLNNNFQEITNIEFIKKHIRDSKKLIDNTINLNDGYYFVYQPLGSQMPPDFMLFNVNYEKIKLLKFECKSGKKIMWNDSIPDTNTIYICLDTKQNSSYLFSGVKECLMIFMEESKIEEIHNIRDENNNNRKNIKIRLEGKFDESSFTFVRYIKLDISL